MSENTFNSQELNLQIQPLPVYIDSDGAFKLNTPKLSSFNFDGLIPKFDGTISASSVKPGYLIKIDESGEYFPVVSIEYEDDDLEDTPSGIITINYIDNQGDTLPIQYNENQSASVIYENWDEKILGSQGWGITSGGNAIFTNVAVRGDLEATTLDVGGSDGITYDGNTVTIGASVVINAPVTFNGSGSYVSYDYLSASYADLSELATSGTTIINGGNITTGVINANLITSGSVTGRVIRSNSSMTSSSGTGVYLDGNGNVRFSNSNAALTFDSSGLTISGTSINVLGYATDDELSSGLNGKISNGGAASDIKTTNTTITGGNISTGNIKSGGYSGPGTGSAFSSLGMLINLDHGSLAAPNFRIDKDGFSFFKGQVTSTGLIIEGGNSTIGYTRNISGTQSPQTDFYSILSLDGKDIFLKAATGDPAKIRWIDSSSRQRATIGWEVSDDEGGEGTANPNTLVVRSNSIDTSPADTPGQILIHAQGEGSSINLKTGTNGTVTINGEPIETPGTITNRYKNGTDSPNNGNTIKYGTSTTLPTGAAQGDIYLRYV